MSMNSNYSGGMADRQVKNRRHLRELKRAEAEERQSKVKPERTRQHRLSGGTEGIAND